MRSTHLQSRAGKSPPYTCAHQQLIQKRVVIWRDKPHFKNLESKLTGWKLLEKDPTGMDLVANSQMADYKSPKKGVQGTMC